MAGRAIMEPTEFDIPAVKS